MSEAAAPLSLPSSVEIESALTALATLSSLLDGPALDASGRARTGLARVAPSLLAPLAPLSNLGADASGNGSSSALITVPVPVAGPDGSSGISLLALPPAQAALIARRGAFRPREALDMSAELQRRTTESQTVAAIELAATLLQRRTRDEEKQALLAARARRAGVVQQLNQQQQQQQTQQSGNGLNAAPTDTSLNLGVQL